MNRSGLQLRQSIGTAHIVPKKGRLSKSRRLNAASRDNQVGPVIGAGCVAGARQASAVAEPERSSEDILEPCGHPALQDLRRIAFAMQKHPLIG